MQQSKFKDTAALLNIRKWLEKAIKAEGAKPYGMGIGIDGRADISFDLEGMAFNVSIKPI